MEAIETIDYRGYAISIYPSECDNSPQDWGLDQYLVGFHNDFWVEEKDRCPKDLAEAIIDFWRGEVDQENEDNVRDFLKNNYVWGLEAYIHSGVVLAIRNEGNFCDRQWDVSYLGLVVVPKELAVNKREAKKIAEGLIKDWNDYLSGNVYGYIVADSQKNETDSCWGYYGSYMDNGMIQEAKNSIDIEIKKRIKRNDKRLKAQILKKVNISYRLPACL